jgi:hypothetical protein
MYPSLPAYRRALHEIAIPLTFQTLYLSICRDRRHTNRSYRFLFRARRHEAPNKRTCRLAYTLSKLGPGREKLRVLVRGEPTIL